MVEASTTQNIFCCKTKQFLCATPKDAEQRYIALGWEKIEVEELGDDKVALKSCHGKYLSAQPNGNLEWNRDNLAAWETFTKENA